MDIYNFIKMTVECEGNCNRVEIYKTYNLHRIGTVQNISNIFHIILWIIFTNDKFIERPKSVCN